MHLHLDLVPARRRKLAFRQRLRSAVPHLRALLVVNRRKRVHLGSVPWPLHPDHAPAMLTRCAARLALHAPAELQPVLMARLGARVDHELAESERRRQQHLRDLAEAGGDALAVVRTALGLPDKNDPASPSEE
jgi:hypothetical protein